MLSPRQEPKALAPFARNLKPLWNPYPRNGHLRTFTLEDAERAMHKLPEGIAMRTRRAYGQAMRRVLEMAVYPCKVAASNPLPRGLKWTPEFGP